MILFVETNFVLELAFMQEDHGHCRALLDLAKGREDLEMVLPASGIVEAYAKQIARQRDRTALHSELRRELNELSRSKPTLNAPARYASSPPLWPPRATTNASGWTPSSANSTTTRS